MQTENVHLQELYELKKRQFRYWDTKPELARRAHRRYWLMRLGCEALVVVLLFVLFYTLAEMVRKASLSAVPESIYILGFPQGISITLALITLWFFATDWLNYALNLIGGRHYIEAQFGRQFALRRKNLPKKEWRKNFQVPTPVGTEEDFIKTVNRKAERITPLVVAICGGWFAFLIANLRFPRWFCALAFIVTPWFICILGDKYTRLDDKGLYFRASNAKDEYFLPYSSISGIELVKTIEKTKRGGTTTKSQYRLRLKDGTARDLTSYSFRLDSEGDAVRLIAKQSNTSVRAITLDSTEDKRAPAQTKTKKTS